MNADQLLDALQLGKDKEMDFDDPANNDLVVCNQWTYKVGKLEKRFDIVLLVNGLAVVIGEAKAPVRPAVTWVDGASQIHEDYEQSVAAMFARDGSTITPRFAKFDPVEQRLENGW